MIPKILILILLTIFLSNVYSDDGSWNTLHTELKGNLYSETENKDITLEKEILIFGGLQTPSVEAIFQFKNLTKKELTIEAGFPIELKIPVNYNITQDDGEYYFPINKYGGNGHLGIAEMLFGDKLKYNTQNEDYGFTGESSCYFTKKDIDPRKKISAKDYNNFFKFTITQNNKTVKYDFVIIDTKVQENYLIATIHYHHNLSFKPGETSIVKVNYYDECLKGNQNFGSRMNNQYEWNYILGTGGTWKDSIKKLYFVLPSKLSPNLPKQFKFMGSELKSDVYLAENYKPGKDDAITILESYFVNTEYYFNYMWFEEPVFRDAPNDTAGGVAVYKNSSSFIKEKTTIYTEEGIIEKIDYSGMRLFDGVRESAWSEGKKDDGIGEWVEFELLNDVKAIEIQNGFNKSFYKIEGKDIDTFYEKNNRVKVLEFISGDQKNKKTINLSDKKDATQFFDVDLPKGVYKVYIRDIYKGTKWSDACLGEIIFYEKNQDLEKLKTSDDFFKNYYQEKYY